MTWAQVFGLALTVFVLMAALSFAEGFVRSWVERRREAAGREEAEALTHIAANGYMRGAVAVAMRATDGRPDAAMLLLAQSGIQAGITLAFPTSIGMYGARITRLQAIENGPAVSVDFDFEINALL